METINAAILVEVKEIVQDTALRATFYEILKDEVQHARIGWAALSLVEETERKRVWNQLPQIFHCAGIHAVMKEKEKEIHRPEWGIFGGSHRLSLFEETMNKIIFPGFWSLGLSSDVSWNTTYTEFLNS
jgi:hypothetical protein